MKQNKTTLSIIIPVLNEENQIEKLITAIAQRSSSKNIKEIIVVDGGSTDKTTSIASKQKNITVLVTDKGRAKQMNFGAKAATGDILYFLHADTIPPNNFDTSILNAMTKSETGCFRMQFDSNSTFLKISAWFTRINHKICRGGDQSLFITQKLFTKLNGFNEAYIIYEDNEFIERLYKASTFTILPDKVTTSARKYQQKGTLKLQYHFGVIHLKKILGKSPEELYRYYKRNIID